MDRVQRTSSPTHTRPLSRSPEASSLEPLLLLAFLEHNRVSQPDGELTPDLAAGLKIDRPDFLEPYPTFLAERGDLELALRSEARRLRYAV